MIYKDIGNKIWALCDKLRSHMDGPKMKDYILPIIFYKFISRRIKKYIEENWKEPNFNYSDASDEKAENLRNLIVKKLGFFLLPSQLFENLRKEIKNNPSIKENLNLKLKKIFEDIEGSNESSNFKGLLTTTNWDDKELGDSVIKRNENIIALINITGDINFADNQGFEDNLGDIYEFLISKYAANGGKKGGEFYTPAKVSELLSRIVTYGKEDISKIYDPTCGSGSLLLKFMKIYKEKIKIFGQEKNIATYNLCKMNMFIHGVSFVDFDIALGDTLMEPKHEDKFDVVVSNPPYSQKWDGETNSALANDKRFTETGGIAPKSYADFAFIQHSLSKLNENGVAAIVCATSVLTRSVSSEENIRKWLIENNYIDCVIQLTKDLFYGTSIDTIILVLRKNKQNEDVLFIDASDMFVKAKNKNELSDSNIEEIMSLYSQRESKEFLCYVAKKEEIRENNHSLGIKNYVQKEQKKEIIDPKELVLNISETVKKINTLRTEIDEIFKDMIC